MCQVILAMGQLELWMFGKGLYTDGGMGINTKYKTIYKYNIGPYNYEANYALTNERYGEAIWETSSQGINNNTWYGGYSRFGAGTTPYMVRRWRRK